ncbi:non-ribosomal peptide synthetase [Chitinophaga sp. HK235]|uniref:non-ribosomal peptide synthetase n=1 Tax=Chitinophaga sp. HK235 TaxID=2952571 RepID=UPI001BA6A7F3|nr:non-ribosomal peptide synthetase [Chitinophaga sp. HK235]
MNKTLQYKIATDYWLEKTGKPELSEISGTSITPVAPGSQTFALDEATAAALKKICNDQDTGIYVFLVTALSIFLHKYTAATELLIAGPAPVLSNGDTSAAPVFLSANIQSGTTIKQLLQSFQEELKTAYSHRDYPFDKFSEKYQALHGSPRDLFNYAFSYFPLTGANSYREQSKLSFDFRRTATSFELEIHHTGKYAAWFITQMGVHLHQVLQFIVSQPGSKVEDVTFLSSAEKQQLLETFNDTAVDFAEKDQTILALFEKQAKLHPEQVAVQYEDKQLTYHALWQHALQLATLLKDSGIGPKDVVALVCDRSEMMITGMLGVLKAGAAYLPVDADYPDERIQYILKDSAAKFILTTRQVYSEKQDCFSNEAGHLLLLDGIKGDKALADFTIHNAPEDPAYVIYTSGSTGRPKGIAVKHSGVTNFIVAYKGLFNKGIDTSDRVLALANISFDASIAEIFVALTSGATLVVLDKSRLFDAAKLAGFLQAENITFAYIPPVLLKEVYDQLKQQNKPLALNKLFVGAESVIDHILYDYASLIKGIDILNVYGPTETTVIVTTMKYKPALPSGENVSIGKPIPNCRIYILNNALEPVPAGVPGELCIAGAGVTLGYLNNETLTAAKFVDDPFHPGQKMYLSGDLARWTPDGNIQFIGRKDNQVKIRGYRIEPGEIATILQQQPAVKEAVVAPLTDDNGSKYLCAWVVPAGETNITAIRAALSAQLPEYMIPARFVMLEKIPVTSNGKTDFKKLPHPAQQERVISAEEQPANQLEEQLLAIWQELLNIRQIGTNDNFFELGGHSLKAAKLITIILRDLHVEIPLRQVFVNGTIKQLAAYIRQAEQSVRFEIPVAAVTSHSPASFSQRGIYLSYLLNKEAINYNMPSSFEVIGKPDIPRLEAALKALMQRHAILRTGFSFTDEVIMQHIADEVPFEISVVHDEQPDFRAYITNLVRPFDLSNPPMLRALFIQKNDNAGILLFDMHHIISDGISMEVFMKDLQAFYLSEQLPPLKIQYRDYTSWLDDYRNSGDFEKNKQYWLNTFADKQVALDLPVDFPRSAERSLEGELYIVPLDKATASRLRKVVNKEGSTLFLLALAAYNLLLARYTGKKNITVGTPVAGRVHPDLEQLIGMFVHTLPVRCSMDMQQSFTTLLEQVRSTFFTALDHQLYPMEELAEQLELARDLNRNPLFDTMFSYHDLESSVWSGGDFSLVPLELDMKALDVKFDLSASLTTSGEDMMVLFNYSKSLFKAATIEQMAAQYISILEMVSHAPSLSLEAISQHIAPEKTTLPLYEDQPALFRYLGIDDSVYSAAYPLNTTQRDIYLTCVLDPEGYSLRPLAYFHINNPVDVPMWEAALQQVTLEEDGMRSVILTKDAEVFQAVKKETALCFSFLDISREVKTEADIPALVKKYCDENQDISKPPYKHYLFKVNDQHYVMAVSAHHLFVDGTSLKLLVEKTDNAYHLLKAGKYNGTAHTPYRNSVLDHLARFDTTDTENFWKNYLADVQPLSYSGAWSQEDKMVAGTLPVTGEEVQLLQQYCEQHGLKPHIFFKAVFVLLTKYYCSADQDFCIRENIAGRDEHEMNTIGVFSHVFPLLVTQQFFNEGTSFAELCRHLQQQKRTANPYRDISLALQNHIIGDEPLSFFYNYQNYIAPDTKMKMSALQRVYSGLSNHIELRVTAHSEGYTLKLEYNEKTFNGTHFLDRVQLLLTQVLRENIPLQKLQYLTQEELQELTAFGSNPGEKAERNVLELFEEQVQQKPDHVAVVFRDKNITYAELDRAADAVAAHLQEQGAQTGDIIGIMVDRSEWMIIGMLGVMKSGAAYLPIDPEYPQDRIDYLLSDSNAKMLLTHASGINRHPHSIIIEEIAQRNAAPVKHPIAPDQLAYVIYTSGTTGRPKGVLVEHRALSNVDLAWRKAYDLDKFEPRSLQMASFSFDMFTGEVVRMLTNGGRAIICTSEIRLDPVSFYELLTSNQINVLESTPALIAPLMDYIWEHKKDISFLKMIIVGSDACPLPFFKTLLERYAPGIRVLNSYGVTETCVDSGFYETSVTSLPAAGNTPIGTPLLNYTYYVCNASHQLVPVGQPGELWIGGAGVARGYQNRPDTTAEKFIISPHTQERVYRTGDLVRWLPCGNLEFMGRGDEQVKVRGYRIELKEIESVLLQLPQIKEVAVTVFGQANEKEMVCWYVSQSGKTLEDLKEQLKQYLPDYMVPAFFIALDHLPVTHNGKIDKKSLQDPLKYMDTQSTITATPETATEQALLTVWQDILKRNKIGVLDNFFELGGQSLRAMVLVSRIQKNFSADISLKDIFTYPTIRSLAVHIDNNALSAHQAPITKIAEQPHYLLSPAQKRMYVISHFKGAEISHNICDVCWVHGQLDIHRLEAAFQAMTNRHESLRTSFSMVNGEPVQVIHPKGTFHLTHLHGKEEDATTVAKNFVKGYDLSQAPLLRATVMEVNPEKHLLLFDIHHIISDEVSTGIFLRELWALYRGAMLPELSVQYKDYVAWLYSPANAGVITRQKQYWVQQLQGELPVMEMPYDFPRPLTKTFEGKDHLFRLDDSTAARALEFISRKGITLNMLMLSVYNILLSKYTSLEDIIVGIPVAGRTHADLEPVIGMFVNTLALRSYPTAEKVFEHFLDEVKATALAAYENQDYPFEELVETLQIKRDPGRNPLFDVLFQFISKQPREEYQGLHFEPFPLNMSVAKFDLTFLTIQSGEQIDFLLNYNSALLTEGSAQRFVKHFCNVLKQVLNNPAITLREVTLPDEAEIAQLRAFGGSPEKDAPRVTIPQLWQEKAPLYKDQIAVETSAGSITFGELDQQSTTLAIYLQEVYQVKPGDKVALMLQRTLDMPVALLAILKTGAAYVPVDPSFPAQRIEYILNNSECTMILADKDYHYSQPLFNIHGERQNISQQQLKPIHISPDDLAYIIYTSGSTGVPKGAMLEHLNVTSFVRNFEPVYGIVPGDKILAISNITFDLSVLEILCSLLSGVTVLLANDAEINDFPKVKELILQHKVNTLQMTPSRLSLFLNTVGLSVLSDIKTVITGGEPVTTGLFNSLKRCKNTRVFTSCGPTETCIYSTTDEAKDDRITIGKPLLNEQVFIVGNHGQLQPINVVGEIYIAGSGVGRGYCNQEALTNEKYFRDETLSLSPERIYKSGDIGRWLPDGRIECLGRKDTQVKLRGYRIELGELENALGKMEGIGVTAAIITTVKGEKQIAAFYEADREYGYSTIRTFLADRLPSYMLPLFCIHVEKMPINSNGKIDRKALDQLAQQHQAADRPFDEPVGTLQKALAEIWKSILDLDRISSTDNFFEIGGNSIKLIQVLNRIKKELDVNVPLTAAFTYPTIKALAEKIKMITEFGSVSEEEFYSVANAGKPQTIFCLPPAIGYSFIYAALAEYFPDYTICCLHFIEEENRLEKYFQVMDELQPDQPLILLGYSAGGNFAFELAKELENRGREVSDIILLDSFKRWLSKAKTPVELEATVHAYYQIVDWSIFAVEPEYLEVLKKNTMSKIEGYCKYMNGKTDPDTTNARIHLVKSKDEWQTPETNRDWKESSTNSFHIYEGEGRHPEMFNPEYISHNAGLISTILQQINVSQPSVV